MNNPVCHKFESVMALGADDRRGLDELVQRSQRLGPREDIIQEGDSPAGVNLILEGWACRYKQLEDGRRQIISFFLPGDMCDPHVSLFKSMEHSIGTLTPVTYARVPADVVASLSARSQTLADAFWWDMMVSAEIQREWTVSLGRRTAIERIAHLFCELAARLIRVKLTNGRDFELPITQTDLGDAMGLSSVHVNRTLQDLRATGLITLKGKRLTIDDSGGLAALGLFDPTYLHLEPVVGSSGPWRSVAR